MVFQATFHGFLNSHGFHGVSLISPSFCVRSAGRSVGQPFEEGQSYLPAKGHRKTRPFSKTLP